MLVRRLLVLAVVAAGMTCVPAATAATAATGKCVALVVDASAFGAPATSSCVRVPADATGSDVLVKSGHRVTFDPRYGDDFICAIDGRPAGGCHATDTTHYWAYYHRSPGSTAWHISEEGAGTFRPANASTEGWVYDNGAKPAPQPANVPYRSICTAAASPTPTRSAAAPTRVSPTPSAARRATTRGATTTAAATPSPSPTATRTPGAARRSASQAAAAVPTPLASPSPTASAIAAPASPAAGTAPARRGGLPLGLLVGIAAAAALGIAATVRLRRGAG